MRVSRINKQDEENTMDKAVYADFPRSVFGRKSDY